MLYPSEWVGSLELKRNSSKSGFCGVIPAGKKWQARIYKPEKQRWDPLGTYPTAHERSCSGRGDGEAEAGVRSGRVLAGVQAIPSFWRYATRLPF